jgi:antitoxin YefM
MTLKARRDSISITEARDLLTQLPEELAEHNQAIAVTRRGEPVMALMPWELYATIEETLEVLADPELMDALRQSIREVAEGKLIPWEDARTRLGL